jgi:CRP-like cAMP-binding protein
MGNKYEILSGTELFAGIEASDIAPMLACLAARPARFEKNRIVFSGGERAGRFGIVLEGRVQIYQEDYYGNKSILRSAGAGELFAEAFAFAESQNLPFSVAAAADCELLLIDGRRLANQCSHACVFHGRLIRNMLNIIALENIALTRKIEFTSKRTTREKLLAYLSSEARATGSGSFQIPFNRQELADYLFVDRSAMSAELGRLRDEGVLLFQKNRFELLQPDQAAGSIE